MVDLDEKGDAGKGSQQYQLACTMLDITTISWMERTTITGTLMPKRARGCGTNVLLLAPMRRTRITSWVANLNGDPQNYGLPISIPIQLNNQTLNMN
jgi:hypothetical protein